MPDEPLDAAFIGEGFADGLPGLDPSPDDDAWEAFLTLALERIDGGPGNGLTNGQLAELEGALGAALPFEIGLLLVMGVPATSGWWTWESPATDLADWNATLRSGIQLRVRNGFWADAWGLRPGDVDHRVDAATEALSAAPKLLPIFNYRCVPVSRARGEESSDSNPILSVAEGHVATFGDDLAAWLHSEFEVPLPMWPPTAQRWFPFWSEL